MRLKSALMKRIFYVNTPLSEREYKALEAAAKAAGRSKGQQLRVLAFSVGLEPPKEKEAAR